MDRCPECDGPIKERGKPTLKKETAYGKIYRRVYVCNNCNVELISFEPVPNKKIS